MLKIRLDAYHQYRQMKLPTFGPDLSQLNLDELRYFNANRSRSAQLG